MEPVGQLNPLEVPRFAGPATFARLPRREDVPAFEVAVVGVPFDSSVTYRPGARFGPAAVRQGSRLLKPYNPALNVLPFAAQQVVDAGDIACNPFAINEAITQVESGPPESGGLTSRELLSMLRGLAGLNIVAADVVEVAPPYDHAEITAIAAATVTYELVSLLAKGRP